MEKKLFVICEGQTEEGFVLKVLHPHFARYNLLVFPHILVKRGQPGGDVKYSRLRDDIKRLSKNDGNTWVTCLIDFYGIKEFPKIQEAKSKRATKDRYDTFITNFTEKLQSDLYEWQMRYFIPYIQMHEFEALLFANTGRLAECFFLTDEDEIQDAQDKLSEVAASFSTPEDINNNKRTAPNKRLKAIYPGFQKTLHGVLAAEDIGMREIKAKCPLFKAWIERLEALG